MAKILLVEDDETMRNMLARRLARKGYDVIVACNGREGIAAAAREKPALILMDLSLPEVDGWSASRQIKAAQTTRHIPIIALTAHAMRGDREKALGAGCDDYEIKPIDFPRLLSRMDSFMNGGAVS
jgi:CheY-like chemotaxis protein